MSKNQDAEEFRQGLGWGAGLMAGAAGAVIGLGVLVGALKRFERRRD